jgi:cytochrome c553
MKAILLLVACAPAFAAPAYEAARAILESRCAACHGQAQTSGLDIRQRETILKGGKRGPAVIPGKADESLLYKVVAHVGDLQMPPAKPLTAEEVAVIRAWINEGAVWEGPAIGSTWWAFQPTVRRPLPSVSDPAWDHNPVDAFIWAKLREKGLKPAPAADRRTFIRRASLDLHGLPPPPADVDVFVNDPAPDAYEKLIDKLLASPRYGERWGRHWLDVVRYADTGGFETDMYYRNAWRYRDYVVQSFNNDKSYDRFVQEQIAGDELWPDDLELAGGYDIPPDKLKHLDARIGTGLYTIGTTYHEAALNGSQLRYEWLSDAVDTTGEAFLGLTLACSRCHDHKFDPLTQRDYHRMLAIFAGSEEREIPVVSKMDLFGFKSGYPANLRVEEYKEAIQRIEKQVRDRAINEIESKFPPETIKASQVALKDRTLKQMELAAPLEEALTVAGLRENAAGKAFVPQFTPKEKDERERLIYELGKAALEAHATFPSATVLAHTDLVPDVYMTSRGDFHPAGPKVAPGFPRVLGGVRDLEEPADRPFVPERRRALALWLTRPEHPLTARVLVNRVWYWHFGKGIVGTPSDFGRQGEAPTHPELLDWLASNFVEQGWSIKQLHRLIMLSATYRMSSQYNESNANVDPSNQYLWRMNRQRMDAETLRDSVLCVAGVLNLKMGGRPAIPPLTKQELAGMWAPSQWPVSLDPAEHNRRSIYLYAKRSFPFPMLAIFDQPDTAVSCPRREVTTVAPQALALLNSQFMEKQARNLAARLQATHPGDRDAWVSGGWQLVLGREPSADEKQKALAFLHADSPELDNLCLVLLNMNEFLYID